MLIVLPVLSGIKLQLVSEVVTCHRWTMGWCNMSKDKAMCTASLFWWKEFTESTNNKNNSSLHCCCKPCVLCDDGPGLIRQLFLCCTYSSVLMYGIKSIFIIFMKMWSSNTVLNVVNLMSDFHYISRFCVPPFVTGS